MIRAKRLLHSSFDEMIDPTDNAFLSPDNMIEAVRTYLGKPELPLADVLSSVYYSLANSYHKTVKEIENICGKEIKAIHIVGGGSKDMYLNKLTAQYTGKKVYIGLNEATATGNLLSQIMYDKNINLNGARQIVKDTFNISEVTDYFDASINRISAWTVGFRNVQKALLMALLSPNMTELQNENN